MFERMKAGWRLAKSVRKSVSGHKGLVTYPLLSGITAIIIFIATFMSLFFTIPLDFCKDQNIFLYSSLLMPISFKIFLIIPLAKSFECIGIVVQRPSG